MNITDFSMPDMNRVLLIVTIPIVLYILLSILWNQKYLPYAQSRGKVTERFGQLFSHMISYSYKEDSNVPKKLAENKKLAKILQPRKIVTALTLLSLMLYLVNLWLLATITLFFVLSMIVSRSLPILNERKRVLNRMFAVASTKLHYPKGSDLHPWDSIKIKGWTSSTIAQETVISIPPNYDATSPISRDAFENHFNAVITDQNSWDYHWDTVKGTLTCIPVKNLPTQVAYPGSADKPWNIIPLGVGTAGEVCIDIKQYPHILIAGTTGSGKSVIQRNIVFHVIQHSEQMVFLGIDLKKVELGPYKEYQPAVMGVGTSLEDAVEILRYVNKVMYDRYQKMEDSKVKNFADYINPESGKPDKFILLMIDEAAIFLGAEGIKTEEGKMRDELHGEATTIVGDLLKLGRAAGIHLVMATQRPDAKYITGEMKAQMDIRIAAGRMDTIPSTMVLDSSAATRLPAIKGRGVVRFGGGTTQFQGYYAEETWVDEWLLTHSITGAPNKDDDSDELDDFVDVLETMETNEETEAPDYTEETILKEELPIEGSMPTAPAIVEHPQQPVVPQPPTSPQIQNPQIPDLNSQTSPDDLMKQINDFLKDDNDDGSLLASAPKTPARPPRPPVPKTPSPSRPPRPQL